MNNIKKLLIIAMLSVVTGIAFGAESFHRWAGKAMDLAGVISQPRTAINSFGEAVVGRSIQEYQELLNDQLIRAVVDQQNNKVKLLIALGANVDYVDEYKNSPLMYAVEKNSSDIVQTLIDAGANVNYVNPVTGKTPLINAAQDCKSNIVQKLVDAGVNVNYSVPWITHSAAYYAQFSLSTADCEATRQILFEAGAVAQ